ARLLYELEHEPVPARTDSRAQEHDDAYACFDDAETQRNFIHSRGEDDCEVSLAVHGIHCANCEVVIQSAVHALPGGREVAVDLAAARGRVRWAPSRLRLARILGALARAGYASAPDRSLQAAATRTKEERTALKRLGVALLGMMQVMMFAVPAYLSEDGVAREHELLLQWASLVVALPVMFYSAWPFFRGAFRVFARGRLGMDVPAALGLAIAFGASAWQTLAGGGDTWYDSITMFVCFVLAARYFEFRA